MAHAQGVNPPGLLKFPAARQRRLDALLEKNREGTISIREQATLTKLVAEAEQLMVRNAQLLADFSKKSRGGMPADAVPVTVWVAPATVGR